MKICLAYHHEQADMSLQPQNLGRYSFFFLVFLFICKSCNLRLKLTEPTSKAAEKYQPKATICFLFLSQDCIFWGAVKTIVLKRLSSESWTGLGWKGTLKDHPVKHFSCFISWKNVTFKIQKGVHQKIRYEAKVPCCWWVLKKKKLSHTRIENKISYQEINLGIN